MEEGTGISLYILVGIIIFGLFVGISVLFGEGILANSEDIIACVESFVSDEPTECNIGGDSDPSELPEEVDFDWESVYPELDFVTGKSYYSQYLGDDGGYYKEYREYDELGNVTKVHTEGDPDNTNMYIIDDFSYLEGRPHFPNYRYMHTSSTKGSGYYHIYYDPTGVDPVKYFVRNRDYGDYWKG